MSLLASIIQEGLASARPTASEAGRLYFTTDTGKIFMDLATSWLDVTPPGGVTSVAGRTGAVTLSASDIAGIAGATLTAPPSGGSLTWVNQSTASVATQNGGLYIAAPSSASDSLRALVKTYPGSTPFSFTVGLQLDYAFGLDTAEAGIVLTDGTKHVTLGVGFDSSVSAYLPAITVRHWTNTTTKSALVASGGQCPLSTVWLRVTDDGTNLTFAASLNGISFGNAVVLTEGRLAWLSSLASIGVFVNTSNSAGLSALVTSWSGI